MSKATMAALIAQTHGLTLADSHQIVDTMLSGLKTVITSQGSITFSGFGTFSVVDKPARQRRDPETKALRTIPARRVLVFKAADSFDQALNPPPPPPQKPKTKPRKSRSSK